MTKRFKAGDKVVLSEKAFRENEGSLLISEVCVFLGENKFLTVGSTSSSSSHCNIEEFPQYIFKESWLEPYTEDIPVFPPAANPAYIPTSDKLSLRDQFAIAALMCFRADVFTAPEYIAEKVYKVADAMMEVKAQREKRDET